MRRDGPEPPEPPDSAAVRLYDTTLRDGTQRAEISLSCADKLRIARRLDDFGVSFIEGGWPGSNPKDGEFFARARDWPWQSATIVAFGSCRRARNRPDTDPGLAALIAANTPVCTLFGKGWTLHVTDVLRTTLDDNLRLIEDSVAYLRDHGIRVVYDAEHFFDGFAADASYALETLRAAVRGGAEVVVLCDTNGGAMPWTVDAATGAVRSALGDHPLGIHTHNDSGCAVANALAAVRAGARHIQGTVNGYGERCGNADLLTMVANIELKLGLRCLPEVRLADLAAVSHFVDELANVAPDEHAPYHGRNAFTHKAGVHVAAMRRNERSYQHVPPEAVGNEARTLVSELSGRGNVLSKAEEFGVALGESERAAVLQQIKQAEARGYSYEVADASVQMMLRRHERAHQPPLRVLDYRVISGNRATAAFSEATVKIVVGTHVIHTAAEGNGPVNALDAALRKALVPVYPQLANVELQDYKVRIIDTHGGTSSITRVLIVHGDDTRSWSTVGASTNIIEASLQALVDGLEYALGARPQPASEAPTGAIGAAHAEV